MAGAAKHSIHDQKNKTSETTPTSATVQQSPVRLEVEIARKSIEQKNTLGDLDHARKSLRAAKAIYTKKPRWTISELARHLNVPKSGVFRLVKTFERKDFLQCTEDTYEYQLGSEIWELTGIVFGKRERLVEKAAPYLRDLNKLQGFSFR